MTLHLAANEGAVTRFRDDLARVWAQQPGERLLVAVSGGPDSLALLLLAQAALGNACIAATVDHQLRPESAGEAAFVADLCDRLGVAHTILSGDLPSRAGRTANLSARARMLRYCLLETHAAQSGAARVATAHHADDQVETMVMRMNRGAGVAGLSGIRARDASIVRPLLGWRHAELAALVDACGVTAVSDPSNVDDRFDRARLRKALAGLGTATEAGAKARKAPQWLDAAMWARSAAALADAQDALTWAATRYFDDHAIQQEDGGLLLVCEDALPWEIVRRLFALALRTVDPGCAPTGAELSRLAATMLASDPPPRGSPGRRCCATLGRVRVEAGRDVPGARRFHFAPALPPREHRPARNCTKSARSGHAFRCH